MNKHNNDYSIAIELDISKDFYEWLDRFKISFGVNPAAHSHALNTILAALNDISKNRKMMNPEIWFRTGLDRDSLDRCLPVSAEFAHGNFMREPEEYFDCFYLADAGGGPWWSRVVTRLIFVDGQLFEIPMDQIPEVTFFEDEIFFKHVIFEEVEIGQIYSILYEREASRYVLRIY